MFKLTKVYKKIFHYYIYIYVHIFDNVIEVELSRLSLFEVFAFESDYM